MSLFDVFRKRKNAVPGKQTGAKEEQETEEEFVIATLVPRKVPMTAELMRRQREEELRRKYCEPSVKTGVVI